MGNKECRMAKRKGREGEFTEMYWRGKR